ncbi:MAG: hypothetical protein IJ207_03995 [Treponema sp.]|uniref:hypothetical protein n=1 Tax=Treponema sp. TaxID=166 RepID=UPI0025FE3331|nr:hypothetical protein [Treponema sp.]MBQ9281343.1 hypothetical protein [Treponema sp.]
MEFINANDIKELSNPGMISRQLLNSENSASRRVTITEVHLVAGASQPRQSISATPTRRKNEKNAGKENKCREY